MNQFLRLVLFTLLITFAAGSAKVFAQTTYYWVGGDGNWNDPNSWSLTSGGPVSGATPTERDNVIFNANSLDPTGSDYIVTINANARCADFTWIDVPGVNPILLGGAGLTLQIYGDMIVEAAITNNFEGVIEFLASGSTTISAASPFHSNSTVRFNNPTGIWTLQEKLSVNNIDIISGELNANSRTIDVSGNWIADNPAAIFKSNNGTVVFNGNASTPQFIKTHTVAGSHEFYFLEINNTGAGVVLQSPVTIGVNGGGRMIFIDGIVKTTSVNILTLNNKTQVSGASDISHVDGYVRKVGGDGDNIFNFPIGNGVSYRPAGLVFPNPNPSDNVVYVARYINRSSTGDMNYPPQNATLPLRVSEYEYWEIFKESNQGADARISLTWRIPISGPIGYLGEPATVSSLLICSWSSTDPIVGEWIRRNSTDHTITTADPTNYAGSLRTQGALNSSGDNRFWTIGSEIIPLPIDLLYFQAQLQDEIVKLNWATAQEINNDYFTVEKSTDGQNFTEVLQVEGAGTSEVLKQYQATDPQPSTGVSYYRLKQTDLDGKFSYSKVVPINRNQGVDFLQAYQVSSGHLHVSYQLANAQTGMLHVYDSQGRQVWSKEASATNAQEQIPLTSARGLYLVTLQSSEGTVVKKVIIY